MVITKCDKQCIFVNMIGYCCLDDHTTNVKHTEAQCQRGQGKKAELNRAILANIGYASSEALRRH